MRKKIFLPILLTLGFITTSCSVFSKFDPTKGSVILSSETGIDSQGNPCEKIVYQNNEGQFQISRMSDGEFFWKGSCN